MPSFSCSQIRLVLRFHNLMKRSVRKKTSVAKLHIFCKAAIPHQCHSFLSFIRTQIAPPAHVTKQISLQSRSLGFLNPPLVDAKLSQVVRGTAFSHLFPKKSDRCQLLPTPRAGSIDSPSQPHAQHLWVYSAQNCYRNGVQSTNSSCPGA